MYYTNIAWNYILHSKVDVNSYFKNKFSNYKHMELTPFYQEYVHDQKCFYLL